MHLILTQMIMPVVHIGLLSRHHQVCFSVSFEQYLNKEQVLLYITLSFYIVFSCFRQLSLHCLVDELRQGCFVPRRRKKKIKIKIYILTLVGKKKKKVGM